MTVAAETRLRQPPWVASAGVASVVEEPTLQMLSHLRLDNTTLWLLSNCRAVYSGGPHTWYHCWWGVSVQLRQPTCSCLGSNSMLHMPSVKFWPLHISRHSPGYALLSRCWLPVWWRHRSAAHAADTVSRRLCAQKHQAQVVSGLPHHTAAAWAGLKRKGCCREVALQQSTSDYKPSSKQNANIHCRERRCVLG